MGANDARALLPVPEGPIIRILSVGRFSSLDMAAGDEDQIRGGKMERETNLLGTESRWTLRVRQRTVGRKEDKAKIVVVVLLGT